MTIGGQLLLGDVVLGSKHLTDLHEGFVLGLRNNEDGVDGHSQADHAEDQVTVRAGGHLQSGKKCILDFMVFFGAVGVVHRVHRVLGPSNGRKAPYIWETPLMLTEAGMK